MSQKNNKRVKASKLDGTEDFWTKLNVEMSDEDIEKLHQQIIEDLGYDPNNLEPVGREKFWLDK